MQKFFASIKVFIVAIILTVAVTVRVCGASENSNSDNKCTANPTVIFNANGGSGSMPDESIPCQGLAHLAKNGFVFTNYSFSHWNTQANNSGQSYADEASFTIKTSNVVLYAQWRPYPLITFDANGGVGVMKAQSIAPGTSSSLSPNAFTYPNHIFVGWNTAADGSGKSYKTHGMYKMDAANVTLYAQWKMYPALIFDPNGGKGKMEKQFMFPEKSSHLTPNTFTNINHTFAGWNTIPDGTGKTYADGDSYVIGTSNATLYAQWIPYPTVSFDANGARGSMEKQSIAPHHSAPLAPNAFIYKNYIFMGWNEMADGSKTSYPDKSNYTMRESDVTLYAQWKPYPLIIFDPNGGSGTMQTQSVAPNTNTHLAPNNFMFNNHTFAGWNTSADNSGDSYTDGSSFTIKTSDVKLYAQWRPYPLVIYDPNGGSGDMQAELITPNTSIHLTPHAFMYANHIFSGWNTCRDNRGDSYADGQDFTIKTSDVRLYAQWIPYPTVTYDANGGKGTMAPEPIAPNSTTHLTKNTFTNTNYTFAGWNTASNGSGTSYVDGADYLIGASNVTLYAQWMAYPMVSFDANGGSGVMLDQYIEAKGALHLTANAFTFPNHIFSGWNTQADGKGTNYEDG
ncbi:MAG: InlB B-repeat-containing protein, partial [Candidatus Omnitrophica bacterium]|nr:InlB B-repeat-containing protein [Candidatus Omnitrophota bacterium]